MEDFEVKTLGVALGCTCMRRTILNLKQQRSAHEITAKACETSISQFLACSPVARLGNHGSAWVTSYPWDWWKVTRLNVWEGFGNQIVRDLHDLCPEYRSLHDQINFWFNFFWLESGLNWNRTNWATSLKLSNLDMHLSTEVDNARGLEFSVQWAPWLCAPYSGLTLAMRRCRSSYQMRNLCLLGPNRRKTISTKRSSNDTTSMEARKQDRRALDQGNRIQWHRLENGTERASLILFKAVWHELTVDWQFSRRRDRLLLPPLKRSLRVGFDGLL